MRGLQPLPRPLLRFLVAAVAVPMAIKRLRRVSLAATRETTPRIVHTQVQPGMRRLIISDLHLGGGDRLDDFDADHELATFIRDYADNGTPTELILSGDTFEFLQVRLPGLDDYDFSPQAAVRRLGAIMTAHPDPILALRAFVANPENQITVLIGNHDFELHYEAAKRYLRQSLGVGDCQRVRFGISYEGGGIYLEHGNQFDPWSRFVRFEGISEPFEVVRSTQVVKDIVNQLEDQPLEIAPLIDNVKPASVFARYMLSLPQLYNRAARKFVILALVGIVRSAVRPLAYRRRPRPIRLRDLLRRKKPEHRGMKVHWSAVLAQVAARLVRRAGRKSTDVAVEQKRAERRLRRDVRAFRSLILRSMAEIAYSAEHQHNSLFVCGHSHIAQVVRLNDHQTYINTGTWTEVILNIVNYQREEQRFPFLEVIYRPETMTPVGRLLVWRGVTAEPQPWNKTVMLRSS